MNPTSERILVHFQSEHVPEYLQDITNLFADLAVVMAENLDSTEPVVGAEVTTGLRKLLEAKDCFVRARVCMSNKD
jgi:hypothetical protein